MKELIMYDRDGLEEGHLIQFVGVHVLKWERMKRDYGIPDWDFAFVYEEIDEDKED